MKINMKCPHAKHEPGTMRILCEKMSGYCAHQFFKSCKGWWALTEMADRCPVWDDIKEVSDGQDDQTDPGGNV